MKKLIVGVVGMFLVLMGLTVVGADVQVVHKTGSELHKLNTMVGCGLAVIGAYCIDPGWVIAFAKQCAPYLPSFGRRKDDPKPPAEP